MMIGMLTMPTYADKQKTSELPEMAFLEFLAEMQEVDGQLLAPTDLLDAQPKLNNGEQDTVQSGESVSVNGQVQNDISALLEFLNLSDSQEKKTAVTSQTTKESTKAELSKEEDNQ